MLKFVPEGQNDAAMIRFDDKTNIMIWKELDSRDQKFCLKWDEENSVSTYDRKEFFKLFYGIQKSCLFCQTSHTNFKKSKKFPNKNNKKLSKIRVFHKKKSYAD